MSLFSTSSLNNNDPMHVYYDLSVYNNNIASVPPTPLIFEEVRNNPFLKNPENYYMSIVRFQVTTSDTIPVFIPEVQLQQTDVNKLIYSITMKYKTYEFQQYVEYIPDDLTQSTPNPPLTVQDLSSSYYYVSTYQIWIEMLNNTLISCFNGLKLAVTAGGDTLPTNYAPFIDFDLGTYTITLNCDVLGYERNLTNPIQIFFNTPLMNLYSTLPNICQSYSATNGKNFLITVTNTNNTNILYLQNYNAVQTYQEDSTVSVLNPVSSVVFTTGLLPILPSNISQPKIFGTGSGLFNVGNNANIALQITDITVPVEVGNGYRTSITYNPSAEYRLIDLQGNNPISAVQISCFWVDNYGNRHPLLLNTGCGATLKMLFRRKDYNNITL